MIDPFVKLTNLLIDGKFKPGAPRFDPSRIYDVFISDKDVVTFNFVSSFIQVPMSELTMEEARIVYDYYIANMDKKENELKTAIDPRPWNEPTWLLKSSYYITRGICLFVLGITIICVFMFMLTSVTSPKAPVNPDITEAINIAMSDPLIKDASSHSTGHYTPFAYESPSENIGRNTTDKLMLVNIDTYTVNPDKTTTPGYTVLVDLTTKKVLSITTLPNLTNYDTGLHIKTRNFTG